MAQNFSSPCPQCGTPIAAGQRFCSNCGATADPGFSKPTAAAPSGEHFGQIPEMPTEFSAPPPPPESMYSQPVQPTPAPNTYYPPQAAPQGFQQAQQGYQPNVAPPVYAQPQKDSSKGVLGQIGCGVLLVILLIVGVCGGLSYVAYRWIASAATTSTSSITTTNTNGNSNGNGSTPQAIPTVTTQINQTVTYTSADLTILTVQEASSFTDDANANSPVLVRVNLKEHNPTAGTIYLFYGENFRLLLPDGTSVTPNTQHDASGIGQAVQRTNWVDFPVPAKVDISKLTLRLGAATQAQMDVPLTGNADLSKYQLKTISPNTPIQYVGLNWMLTTVTSSLSANGKQADTGMRYIVLTLKVDNPTQNGSYPFLNDYSRLQAGSTTTNPTGNTFNSIAAGTTGTTGTITFLMPQSSSSFTLLLLARTDLNPPASQVTTSFQI